MNFIKVSCLIAQAQCLTNWGDCIIYIKLQQYIVNSNYNKNSNKF